MKRLLSYPMLILIDLYISPVRSIKVKHLRLSFLHFDFHPGQTSAWPLHVTRLQLYATRHAPSVPLGAAARAVSHEVYGLTGIQVATEPVGMLGNVELMGSVTPIFSTVLPERISPGWMYCQDSPGQIHNLYQMKTFIPDPVYCSQALGILWYV